MRKGYMLVEVMIGIVMGGALLSVFITMNFYNNIQTNILKQQNTKIILEVTRSRLLKLASDPDSDSFFELLKEDENSTLPIEAGVGTDAWGKRLHYYTVDLGEANDVNASYANTTTSISPNANIAGRLVSSGEDMKLSTTAIDSVSQDDDLMLEIGIGELNHFKLYGGSEITAQTRAYNSAIISITEPTTPIDGTLWYDTSGGTPALKIYNENNTSWIGI